jgi:hypothetical protein
MDPATSERLEAPISIDELKKALKTCKDSSPGPDGIPYAFYKTFYDLLLNPLMQSWQYSLNIGELPPSQSQACISLLPKTGKDKTRIENWRPISLSNCDIKLITKTIALRLNVVLDNLICPCQSAYIPGRNITNNVRILKTYRKYANVHGKQFSIVSLDARKAFDSVDHSYISEVLIRYGFGANFIHMFKTLYKNNESSVLLNGYKSEKFKIERGVKQGDALSCGIFILAIDPLLRNIEKCEQIEPIELTSTNRDRRTFSQKVLAYADDITVITAATQASIQAIFSQYEILTNLSGLTLNADKTEIINSIDNTMLYNIQYNGNMVPITPLDSIIICGIKFSNNENDEYEYNVCRRINEMESQLKKWVCRNLTLNGRNIIAKTFGMSQLIYSFQCCEIRDRELRDIERLYFRFLWSKSWDTTAPDRIKRSILKNEKNKGGLNCMDVKSLYQALAIKNILKATMNPEKKRNASMAKWDDWLLCYMPRN